MKHLSHIAEILAITAVIASSFVSCRQGIAKAERLDLSKTPLQSIDDVFAVQSRNGQLEMRLEATKMEHYDADSLEYDYFPEGISVYTYTAEGLLESVIVSDKAIHKTPKKENKSSDEVWEAYGNVVLHNVINKETMETDTIFWDQTKKEIYTDCYVKVYSPDGFMQGYGMRSDERARNSIIMKPFNNFAVVVKDTTEVLIDSANFIGPLLKK